MADTPDPTQPGANPLANLPLMGNLLVANTPNFVNPAYATPEQQKELYKYGDELMKPQPVKSGWQGWANVVNALVGGNAMHQADTQEQQALAADTQKANAVAQIYAPDGGGATASPSATGGDTFGRMLNQESGGHQTDASEQPLTSPAGAIGIAQVMPGTAPEAAQLAGLPYDEHRYKTDAAYNKALGQAYYQKQLQTFGTPDKAAAAYNAGPSAVEAAIEKSSKTGLPYLSFLPSETQRYVGNVTAPQRPVQVASLDPRAGVAADAPGAVGGTQPPVQGAPPTASPHAAMAQALIGGGAQPANNLPVGAQAIGAFLASPRIDAGVKHQVMEQLAPNRMTNATGQVVVSHQNRPVGPPIADLGMAGNIAGIPAVTSGTVAHPQTNLAVPQAPGAAPGQPGNLSSVTDPNSAAGQLRIGAAATDAAAQAMQAKSAAAQQRFQRTQDQGPALLAANYPLRQVQAVLEKNGGTLPTGKEADSVIKGLSLGNMVSSFLGHPLTDEDSRLTSMELLHKYGTQIATSQAASLNVNPTNLGLQTAGETSPGTGLSGPANLHLVDNLIRLNELAQKRNQFEHDYYMQHGQGPNSYDNFTQDWQKEISGPKAIPLSKYGRKVNLRDGSKGTYVPSTDPSGFSLFRENDPAFGPSVMTPEK